MTLLRDEGRALISVEYTNFVFIIYILYTIYIFTIVFVKYIYIYRYIPYEFTLPCNLSIIKFAALRKQVISTEKEFQLYLYICMYCLKVTCAQY